MGDDRNAFEASVREVGTFVEGRGVGERGSRRGELFSKDVPERVGNRGRQREVRDGAYKMTPARFKSG